MQYDVNVLPFRHQQAAHPPRAVLLTCYMTGSTEGKNLGVAGYSYDFVARLFTPLLASWGEVIPVPHPERNLENAVAEAKARGLEPVHVSFLPFQDVHLTENAPNIVVPAWEFPDIPDHAFDDNPRNDWTAVAARCAMVLVGGPFTVDSLRSSGVDVPVQIVQVPTADEYFNVAPWSADRATTIDCRGFVVSARNALPARPAPGRSLKQIGKQIERTISKRCKSLLGTHGYRKLTKPLAGAWQRVRGNDRNQRVANRPITLPYPECRPVDASGIVYTSIFNPDDGRKNWQDLLTGFLYAVGDCEDATLVLKLITRNQKAVERIVGYYQDRDIPHCCKVIVVCDYLVDDQMLQMAEASTYYLQTTKAEGNCLPLMNFLAAGRPGISPAHSAMGDYFDSDVGFVIESHPEPAAWPHDMRLRLRTSWGRLVWPSIVEQIRASYELAKYRPTEYQALSDRCRIRLAEWASNRVVETRLHNALDDLAAGFPQRESEVAVPGRYRMAS